MYLPKNLSSFLWRFIIKQRWLFLLIGFTSIIWSVNEVFFPYFLKLIVNTIHDFKGNPSHIYSVLAFPLLALVAIWFVMEACMRLQGIITVYTFPQFRANIRAAIYDYVRKHSYAYFANNFAGSIAKKISELPTSSQNIVEIIFFNFTSILVAFVIALILMATTKLLFAGILLLWFILHMGITLLFLQKGNIYWESHAESATTLSGKIVDSLTNILNVRLFARDQYENIYFETFQKHELAKAKKAMWLIEIMRILQGLFGLGLIFGMVFTLVYGWSHGWVTLGDFSLIGMLSFWMLGMIWYMSYQLTVFIREVGTAKEALSLINAHHEVIDIPDAKPLLVKQGKIQFTNVTFAYQKNHPIFENLNVTLAPGKKVGLAGFSGSGKSSFVNLILRFYDLQGGNILIDQQDIAKVTQDSLRENIAMIPQEPTLFHRTLMENIRYGKLNATEEEIIHAAKLAHCHEFIEKLTEGYHSLVGERGIKLSGGQRQRIAIARAILKNSPILILDEATSSLDSVTEKYIQESLEMLMHDRTTIVIAHRLSTLASMDRILVFDKGRIVEDGDLETLLNANGHFAHLWNMQMNGFLPDVVD